MRRSDTRGDAFERLAWIRSTPFHAWKRFLSRMFFLLQFGIALSPESRCFGSTNKFDNPLFADDLIPKLSIELPTQGIEVLRGKPRQYVRVTVREGATVYRNVGLHLKGATGSFRPIDEKPSFTLDFQRFGGNEKFHSLAKIHLNNSVEDPAYVNEKIGSELFHTAGIPAPRVTRSVIELNGRELGLYVLKEGFDEDFLETHFQRRDGALYEPLLGSDIDGKFQQQAGPKERREGLRKLRFAMSEQDLEKRWSLLRGSLDLDAFVTFMALEVMICHRDGYCLARNNFRIYHNPANDKLIFIPHGMDQLFGIADLSWNSHFGGSVARAVSENPEVRLAYRNRLNDLVSNVFLINKLTNRVNALVEEIKPIVQPSELKEIQIEAGHLCERIIARHSSLRAQLNQPEMSLPQFSRGVANLTEWRLVDSAAAVLMDKPLIDGLRALHIVAGKNTGASWRTKVLVNKGIYRFEGLAKVSGVAPKPFGQNQGAGLRVINRPNPAYHFVGESNWKELEIEFKVDENATEIELACELRANTGEAWFQMGSLRLVQLK